jgi:phosphoribosyl 1,2-cyclic phosphate phosphodiesterase
MWQLFSNSESMKIRFLGTGTSTGIPQIGCHCPVCQSPDERDRRLRCSVAITTGEQQLLIDCTPDFRQQALTIPFKKINGILFTHEHYDHTGGIDDLRPYSCFGPVELFMEEQLEKVVRNRLPYCFSENRYGGIPDIHVQRIDPCNFFQIGTLEIIPIRIMHHKLPILGFRIGSFAYLTDVKSIPEAEFEKLRGLDLLVISALRKTEHISHLSLAESLQIIERIAPRRSFLTHFSHEMGLHAEMADELPDGVYPAYDGLEIDL